LLASLGINAALAAASMCWFLPKTHLTNSSYSIEPSPFLSIFLNIFWMSASFIFVRVFKMDFNSSSETVPFPSESY